MGNFNRRYLIYGCVFLLLLLLALWIFHEPAGLDELRRMEPVEQGTEEPLATVEHALTRIRSGNWEELYSLMLEWDRSDFRELYVNGLFSGKAFCPARPVRCARLVHSHRPDNISVFVFSEPRETTYLFSLRHDRQGRYRIRSISREP